MFTVDWRGAETVAAKLAKLGIHGKRDLIQQDAPTLLDHALGTAAAGQAFWVGHSLGALVGYAVLGGGERRLRG